MVSSTTGKRKETRPNHTLLDFFSNSDAVKRARVRTSQRQAPSLRQVKVNSREVIVIDSHSDEDVHERKIGKANAQPHTRVSVSEDSQSLNSLATFTPAYSGDKDAFGAPSELLRSTSSHAETSSIGFHAHGQCPPNILEQQDSEPTFGVPALLLESTSLENRLRERSQTNLVPLENSSSVAWPSPSADFAVDFPIDTEKWAVGDDELAGLEVQDISYENDEGGLSNQQSYCPVCGMDLRGTLILEVQTHVNQCLDATSQHGSLFTQEPFSAGVSIKLGKVLDDIGPSTIVKDRGDDLYSVLMRSHKESEVWAEVDATTNRDNKPVRGNRRRAPFYKVLQGMPIAVDAFCYGTIPGVTAYFLTHAHSDHYTSLGSKWKSGPIYCSEETANLIVHMLGVDPKWIHPLPLDSPVTIPHTGGGKQTTDAGDSTYRSLSVGSARIFRYVHCGDFRASPRHTLHPAVKGKRIDHIYLDTTYLDPKYTFSPQPLVISACVELTKRLMAREAGNSNIDTWMKSSAPSQEEGQQIQQERTLVVVGTYSIGKERIVKAVAQSLGTKIYCDPRKTAILKCQADKELHALLTADPTEASLHVLPLGTVTLDNVKSYLQRFKGTFSRAIGFRPTGWSYAPPSGADLDPSIQSIVSNGQSRHFSYKDLQPSAKSSHNVQIFGVPYSEHSSFFELTCFAMSCDWDRIIPTVNMGSPASRAKLTKWLRRWESEKRNTKSPAVQPRTIDYW